MNLAWRDIRHKLGRFVLTCFGLSLLLAITVMMAGIYRGQTADSLALLHAIRADVWIVESGTLGPFAEASSIPGDTREMVARINGVAEAGSITLQNVQVDRGDRKVRVQVVGYQLGRPGGPVQLIAGREITRSHYELIADRQTGLALGEMIRLGRYDFTVVGMTSGVVTLSGDSIVYITLRDAQQLQFDLAPSASRREAARGVQRTQTDFVNAIVARLTPGVPPDKVAEIISRWKHLSVLTEAEQEVILTRSVIERASKQIGLFLIMLTIVSAVIIALILYTMTMDKIREIATLKLIGASDWTIVSLIMQQALMMGVIGVVAGTVLVYVFKNRLPRAIVLLPSDIASLFGLVIVICLLASMLGVRAALRVDPGRALVG
jgi:putative ABC transport system permease protein